MDFSKRIGQILKQLPLPEEAKVKIAIKVTELTQKELDTPPKIALIGLSGVGKSSTINSLFGTKLEIGHFKACTQVAEPITLEGPNGKIVVCDMPGLGEDIDTDEKHKVLYRQVLPECDVIIWILAAQGVGRAMAYDQLMLKEVVQEFLDKLVIGVNQIDKIDPDDWIKSGNIPSPKQKKTIELRISDVHEKLSKVVPQLDKSRILYYSAKQRYRLQELFDALIDACANRRGWVLGTRQSIADYKELVDPKVLEIIESKSKKKGNRKK